MIRQYELVERVKSYDTAANEDALNKAYVFSMKAHGSQRRPRVILTFLTPSRSQAFNKNAFNHYTIITALLHDTVEDNVTVEEIGRMFEKEIASHRWSNKIKSY